MRFCPFCSAENADELAVCQACGRRLPPLPPRRARNAPPTGIQLPPRPASPRAAADAGAEPVDEAAADPPSGPHVAPSGPRITPRPARDRRPRARGAAAGCRRRTHRAASTIAPSGPMPRRRTRDRRAPTRRSSRVRRRPRRDDLGRALSRDTGDAACRSPPGGRCDAGRDSAPALAAAARRRPVAAGPPLSDARATSCSTRCRPGPPPRAASPPPADRASSAIAAAATTRSPPPLRAGAFEPAEDVVGAAADPARPTSAAADSAAVPCRRANAFAGDEFYTVPAAAARSHVDRGRLARAAPTGDEPPPTRIHRAEAHADRPFTPPKVAAGARDPGARPRQRGALRVPVRARALAAPRRDQAARRRDQAGHRGARSGARCARPRRARRARRGPRVLRRERRDQRRRGARRVAQQGARRRRRRARPRRTRKFVDVERERNAKLAEAERMVEEAQRELQHLEAQRRSLRDKRKELERRQKAYLKNAEDNDRQAGSAPMGDQRQELRRVAEGHRKEAAALEPDRQEIDRRLGVARAADQRGDRASSTPRRPSSTPPSAASTTRARATPTGSPSSTPSRSARRARSALAEGEIAAPARHARHARQPQPHRGPAVRASSTSASIACAARSPRARPRSRS